ncbi:neurotrimin-like [Hylaeus anthracinus]|uniref:neurotrimin-like n=1 Tax=Hylaeus anthracinus TaxID=313031 RepID=UPI0023B9091B|nr:neurotrimin-like [Hylaeus anthracinus]
MLPLRFVGLMVILFAVHGWCKPAKSTEGEEYSDDDPPSSDYNDDGDAVDDNDPGTIEEQPQIISKGDSIRVRNGGVIRLPCLLKNVENVAVTWKRNNETLYLDSIAMTQDNKRITRFPNNTLVIYPATVNDTSDNYECSILQEPPITIKYRVLVDDKSQIPSEPLIRVTPAKKVQVKVGDSVTLGCETSQHPPQIKWFHESTRLNVDPADSNHITLHRVSKSDAGRYMCLLEDGSKDPPLETIVLVVNYPPEIEPKRKLVHTGLGVESDLTCVVHAHPRANVTWYKDQMEVLPEPGRIEIENPERSHTLKILHTEQKDLGNYTCVAKNKLGRAEKIVRLTGAPSQATVASGEVTRSGSGFILKWRLESYSPITEYKLEYRRKGDDSWIVLKPVVTNGKGNQFIVEHKIDGLQSGSYEAILMARNDFGWSQPSEPHIFKGEYYDEIPDAESGPSTTGTASQPAIAISTLLLVVSSCAFTSL